MTTTPTFWGTKVPFSNFFTDFGPQVIGLKDGTFAVVWQREGGDIVGRHFNELGSFTGGDFLQPLTSATTNEIRGVQVLQQNDGRLIVDYTVLAGPTQQDVRRHQVDLTTPNAGSSGLETLPSLDEFMFDATATAGGGSAHLFGVVGATGGSRYLGLSFADANGGVSPQRVLVDINTSTLEQNATITGLSNGSVAIAYEQIDQTTFARSIKMHVHATNGANTSGVVPVSLPGANAAFPDIMALKNNTFVVAWQQGDGMAFRQYTESGAALDATPVVIPNSAGFLPKITALNDGGFIVAWVQGNGTESDGSIDLDIFLQRFDGLGNAVGDRVHFDEPGDQGLFSMSIATLADGRVIVAYGSETGDSTNITNLSYRMVDPRERDIFGTANADNIVGREDGGWIYGFAGNDKLTGRASIDTLEGMDGNDSLYGFAGNDRLEGGLGIDRLDGGTGRDTAIYWRETAGHTVSLATGKAGVTGQTPNETLFGIENIIGTAFNDVLTGNNAMNTIEGGGGNDWLNGGGAGDTLIGNNGRDLKQGGGGADRYTYLNLEDSLAGGTRDRILDFNRGQGDKIDLQTLDANADVHDSTFIFIGTAAFSGVAGQLRHTGISGGRLVAGDVDGDKVADFQIEVVTPLANLLASDFVL